MRERRNNDAGAAIVLGGSRGIGRAIADSLRDIGLDVRATSRTDLDTGNIENVVRFCKSSGQVDVLVLNTGGPPPKRFMDVSKDDWEKYHNQLFLGLVTFLQNIRIGDGGYIFLISSAVIKEPDPRLVISCAYRAALTEVFKILSRDYAGREISCINIAPGPINTDRTRELIDDIAKYEKTLPMGRLGEPQEIGSLVSSIVKNQIKYLSGTTINFDGANSRYVF